ncbi:hypothetical protein SESBI_34195 [Sesbania bispinosa]|nr:hypothetical protein SESBI_34195 [Sesbania bispinosa]
MGRQFQHKHSNSYWENHHPDCNRGLFHIIKHHPLRHFMKRLTYKRGGGETSASGAVPARRGEDLSAHKKKGLNHAETRNSNVGEKVTPYSSVSKNSVGSQIKALIKEISKKKSRHRRSSTCPNFVSSNPYITNS